jgi:hypothetical protein
MGDRRKVNLQAKTVIKHCSAVNSFYSYFENFYAGLQHRALPAQLLLPPVLLFLGQFLEQTRCVLGVIAEDLEQSEQDHGHSVAGKESAADE